MAWRASSATSSAGSAGSRCETLDEGRSGAGASESRAGLTQNTLLWARDLRRFVASEVFDHL